MLTQMFHQRHQRNHQMNGKHPIQIFILDKKLLLPLFKLFNSIINACIFDQQKIHSESRNYSLYTKRSSTFSRWNKKKKKKSNDNTSIPRTNPTKQNPSRSMFAPDIRPMFAQHLPLREKITIILVGAGVVTAVVSICSEISPGPRCL